MLSSKRPTSPRRLRCGARAPRCPRALPTGRSLRRCCRRLLAWEPGGRPQFARWLSDMLRGPQSPCTHVSYPVPGSPPAASQGSRADDSHLPGWPSAVPTQRVCPEGVVEAVLPSPGLWAPSSLPLPLHTQNLPSTPHCQDGPLCFTPSSPLPRPPSSGRTASSWDFCLETRQVWGPPWMGEAPHLLPEAAPSSAPHQPHSPFAAAQAEGCLCPLPGCRLVTKAGKGLHLNVAVCLS